MNSSEVSNECKELNEGVLSKEVSLPLMSPMGVVARGDSTKGFNGFGTDQNLPVPATTASPALPSAKAILGLWALFVLNRAMHPLVIDMSKVDGVMPYRKLSPIIAKCFLSVVVCNLISLLDKDGWRAGLRKCYNAEAFVVFGKLGIFYAAGDYLEMMSMSAMDGAAYQVLLQSKLIITALLMWAIKGSAASQTPTQWSVLITATLGMSLFMLVQSSGNASKEGKAGSGMIGTCFVLGKVFVSCYSAVKADASLKRFKHLPLHAQLSQLMGTWGIMSVLLATVFDPQTVSSPNSFFEGWNAMTLMVVCSFAAKTVLTMTLLKVLDSVLKNIGEAVSVLVIYFAQISLPFFAKEFEANTFVAMLVVVMTVTTYMLLKKEHAAIKEQQAKIVANKNQNNTEQFCSPDAKKMPKSRSKKGEP